MNAQTNERPIMPMRAGDERVKDFNEVNLGLAQDIAIKEAKRCLLCKKPLCVSGCPVNVDIPKFIGFIAEGDFKSAADSLFADNMLPAVTGRVCPQETQCEAKCVRGVKSEPIAIGYLERFVADWKLAQNEVATPKPNVGKRVAIIGSGPAGLTAAGVLADFGVQVTVFEAFHTAGGVLVYGIPEFRLPKAIVKKEIDRLVQKGVKIEYNHVIGKIYTLSELRAEFDAVFISNGAGLPVFMDIPGENLKGVYSANEFLTRVNLMRANQFPENSDTPILKGQNVVVVGGGNVAMDAVRTAKRLGAENAIICYRRTKEEMPARVEEVEHAVEEGIEFYTLISPTEIKGNEENWVSEIVCQNMQLIDEVDRNGRRKVAPIEGDITTFSCDTVVMAIGTLANPILTQSEKDLELNRSNNIVVDESLMTSIDGVFAGGDIVRGAATVILAMGDGKKAAFAIKDYLEI